MPLLGLGTRDEASKDPPLKGDDGDEVGIRGMSKNAMKQNNTLQSKIKTTRKKSAKKQHFG